jgi:LysM repeat protein
MKMKMCLLFAVILLYKTTPAQNSVDIINYINTYKEIAISEMQRSGVPASIILAQGIHETEAGTSELVRKSNNHFGIKCKDTWTGSVVYHDDDERGECFRSYDNPQDSYKDHSDFLRASPRYAFLFRLDPADYQSWAFGLKKAGYATNIRYPQILIKLINEYNLQQYSMIAMGKMSRQEEKTVLAETDNPVSRTTVDAAVASISEKKSSLNISSSPQYPTGEFNINKTKVIFARGGTSLLSIANQYDMPLARLLDFNDLKEEDVLVKDQLLFLQRKRKTGNNEFHIVVEGESLYTICQSEAIRLESLQEMNNLSNGMEPAAGEKLYLQAQAGSRPALATIKSNQQITAAFENPNQGHVNYNNTGNTFTHVVQPKETLYSIAKRYGVDAGQIRQWNKLGASGLKTGQELIIYKN